MAYLDFTQMYPSLAAAMLVVTGLFTILVDRKGYNGRGLVREAKWAKTIGYIWIVAGCGLYLTGWVWRNFIW